MHIRDSEYFGELYSNSLKLDKCSWFYNFVACPGATFATASSDLHRARRGALAKYFSTSNVSRLEPLLNKCMIKLIARLQEHKEKMDIVDLSNAYRCIAIDIISEYALPCSRLLLDTPDFAADEIRVLRDFARIGVWNRHIIFILPLFTAIPRWIIARVDPGPSLAVFDNQTVRILIPYCAYLQADLCKHRKVLEKVSDHRSLFKRSGYSKDKTISLATNIRLGSSSFREDYHSTHPRSFHSSRRWNRNDRQYSDIDNLLLTC